MNLFSQKQGLNISEEKYLLRKNLQVAPMDVGDDRIHLMLFGHLDD